MIGPTRDDHSDGAELAAAGYLLPGGVFTTGGSCSVGAASGRAFVGVGSSKSICHMIHAASGAKSGALMCSNWAVPT